MRIIPATIIPPAPNQKCAFNSCANGVPHYPMVRVAVAHDIVSGVNVLSTLAPAVRPCWGPMYGKKAVSEQCAFNSCAKGLAKQIVARLLAESVAMGDRRRKS